MRTTASIVVGSSMETERQENGIGLEEKSNPWINVPRKVHSGHITLVGVAIDASTDRVSGVSNTSQNRSKQVVVFHAVAASAIIILNYLFV